MEALENIFTRRSIRKYLNQPVPAEGVQLLLKAAMYAPSSGNSRPWHFVVFDERAILNELADKHPYGKMLHDAALAILVCADLKLQKIPNRFALDCAAATQNILLAAHATGLGAVWLGIYPDEKRMALCSAVADLPEDIAPVALVSIGYPAEQKEIEERYQPERVHRNHWKLGW